MESSIPFWVHDANNQPETVANTRLYYNNNGNPPTNINYPASCTPVQTDGSNTIYKLNATTNKTGLEFMIKVMAGDNINIFGKSFYTNSTVITNDNSTAIDLTTLIANILLAPANAAIGKGISNITINSINTGLVPASFSRGQNNEPDTKIPKAYINYIFLDEQFRYVDGGASRVGSSSTVKDHWKEDADKNWQNLLVPKNGYIFVYVSNESNFDVFFDNLQVVHKPGPILEETHYYPFGLAMAGISSKAAGSLTNRKKYNGKELQSQEFSDGSGLEEYDYGARFQDPQIGRWITVDPLTEKSRRFSPYVYANNNPIRFIDPDGMRTTSTDVIKNADGTFKVVAAKADGDKNVYVRSSENGPRTGEVIGKTVSDHSFLNDYGKAVKGAIINLSDKSGANFLKNDIMGNKNLSLIDYMKNATGGQKYDFKKKGINGVPANEQAKYMYRAMTIDGVPGLGDNSGEPTIGTARDVGNIAAGYEAGVSGLGWGLARTGFDALQSYQDRKFTTEGQTTQLAERVGWEVGSKVYNQAHSSPPMGLPPIDL